MVRVSSAGPTPSGDDRNRKPDVVKGSKSTEAEPSPAPARAGGPSPRARPLLEGRRSSLSGPDERVVSYVADMLDAADAVDVKVSPAALKRDLGFVQPSRTRKAIEAARKAIPGLKTESERVAKANAHLEWRAMGKAADVFRHARMQAWFDKLTPAQREAVHVAPAALGGPSWLQPLTIRVDGEPGLQFEAEHMVEWPADVVAHLPEDERAMLAAREKMLKALKISSGSEAAELIDEHFEQERFNINDSPPHEIARLVELHPEVEPMLQTLQQVGGELIFIRGKKTPDAVLDAMRHVAHSSQRNFISTWFRDLVEAGVEPTVTDSDFAKIREDNARGKRKALRKSENDPFDSALAERQYDDALEDELDIQRSIDLIKGFSNSTMSVAVAAPKKKDENEDKGADKSKDNRADVNAADVHRINRTLSKLFGHEYARRRMTFDDANRTSEGAKAIITSLAFLAPGAELLEKGLDLGPIAKAVAAAGDDALAESAEISALKEAGVSKQELLQRVFIAGPAALLSLGMAGSIDEVVKELGDHVGGAMFSTSAVFLSFVTSLLSMQYFAKHHKRLKRENKLPPDLVLDEKTRRALDAVAKIKLSKRDLLRIVDQSLEHSGATQEERTAVQVRLSRFNERKLLRTLRKHGGVPSRQSAVLAGMKEAIAVNPARLGLMAGTVSSPLVGLGLGPWFLHQPVLYAIAGSFETIVGAVSIWAYGRSFDSRWNRFVKRRKAVDSLDTPGEGSVDGAQEPSPRKPS